MIRPDLRQVAAGLKCRLAKVVGRRRGAGVLPYTPFVILCTARTGSEFLKSLLNDHDNVIAWGALFAPASRDRIRWGFVGQSQRASLRELLLRDPDQFLEREVYTLYPASIQAVGFKIFYGHAQSDEWQSVWSYLRRREDIRVLHLRRRNLLARQVSLELAQTSRVWRSRGGPSDGIPSITLDFDKCVEEFRRVRRGERELGEMFGPARVLDLAYEDLAASQATEMSRVFEFLGVENQGVRPATRRQSSGALKDKIENFDELEARFRGSPWHQFFT